MTQTISKHIGRRTIIRGAALSTAAAAVAVIPAIASAGTDPILAVVAERARLYEVFQRASARAAAIDESLAAAEAFGLPRISDALSKDDQQDLILSGRAKFNRTGREGGFWTVDREGVEKTNPSLLSWWDGEMARKQRLRDESGTDAADDATEDAWDAYAEADSRVAETQATTLPGLLATLRIVAQTASTPISCRLFSPTRNGCSLPALACEIAGMPLNESPASAGLFLAPTRGVHGHRGSASVGRSGQRAVGVVHEHEGRRRGRCRRGDAGAEDDERKRPREETFHVFSLSAQCRLDGEKEDRRGRAPPVQVA
jgi:hypothetical protein